ncbi:ras association domain-containing protein 10-like [Micropterus dolomieu]|uniref:ras association domain-containing protein 10-like n=1 Tax=Micropterus dolomieu TaxID=147949 RepID=UPI001E8E7BDF|nr:ras association domain-containing protein 10-like [Micropterus dolomieu]
MESEECKISVWVCREEKLVFGLSKRTTCADVVKVLLEDQNSQHGLSAASHSGCSQSYCIVEKWRGFERILPHKTKILRLWVAWGEEQGNVKFVLVKSEASLANHGARSAEARVVLSKHRPCVSKGAARSPVDGISPEKQRRIVRKAFRKLEKINGKKRAQTVHRDESSAEKMETLAHLVISQDHTIRQQIQRITELESEIERCEAKVHFDRIKKHGINYVQDTYLVDAAAASSRGGEELCSAETLAKFEEYVRKCEEAVGLQEELREQEALIDIITVQMHEELNHRWMQRRKEVQSKETEPGEGASSLHGTEPDTSSDNELVLEGERIRTQLDASSYIGLRLNTDLEAIRSDLELTQEIYAAREKQMRDLLEKVNILDREEGTAREERCSHATDNTGMSSTLERKSEWVEQARGLSKAHSVNDDDSDTGLSSLHSQDSDSHTVWESLV